MLTWASAELGEGIIGGPGVVDCWFGVSIVNVPAGASTYLVSVGGRDGVPAEPDANSELVYVVSVDLTN